MALAYGEPPPNLMTAYRDDEVELKGLVGRAKGLLEEIDCLQHTVTHTLSNLQKNPDQMAAVALTLAEISRILKQMAPGALVKVKMLAPSVFALLSSPSFLVAAGVGVGVTVIALGGYKVIKKIQAGPEEDRLLEGPQQERQMIALQSEVSRIETWRQGIADVESSSAGVSVNGEIMAATELQMGRLVLHDDLQQVPRERSRSIALEAAPRKSKSVVQKGKSVSSSPSRRPKGVEEQDSKKIKGKE